MNNTPRTYTIQISNAQRELLIRALRTLHAQDALPACNIDTECDLDFVNALITLPSEEAQQPGIIHGLCL